MITSLNKNAASLKLISIEKVRTLNNKIKIKTKS
jgi:hypothetical protein